MSILEDKRQNSINNFKNIKINLIYKLYKKYFMIMNAKKYLLQTFYLSANSSANKLF